VPKASICAENSEPPMNSSAPQGSDPKVPPTGAVPIVKIVEQELALKRARLAAEKVKPSRPAERWLALMLILLVLLGVTVWGFIWGWGRIQNYKSRQEIPQQQQPAAPARR
jgi:hypothetical protein